MFRIKSDDQRAKTLKRIERFERDMERLARDRGPRAAASYARTYRPHVEELKRQVGQFDDLRRRGVRISRART